MRIFGKKINFLVIFWVFFYFLVFGLLLRNSFSYLDPDLGWHLKVGEAIAQTGVVPHLNIYNYTFTGNWVDHEWLINFISFEIYSKLGYFSLNIFFAAIIVLSLVLLNFFARRLVPKIGEWSLVFLQLFGLVACLPHFGVRMQEFGFLFLLLELWILAEFNNKKKWPILIWLLPLFYFWASIHGSFLLGLGLVFAWLVIKIIENRLASSKWKKYFLESKIISVKDIKIYFLFFLGSIFITFFTPYGRELYSFLGGYSNTFYLRTIQEWRPQYFFPFNYLQASYLALSVVFLVAYFNNFICKKIKTLDLWQLSLVFLFLILSFKSRRHFPLMFIATFPFLVQALSETFEAGDLKSFLISKKLKYFLLVCLGLAGLSQYVDLRPMVDPFNYFCSKYPCEATKFLQREVQYRDLNILNDYDWGGYLIWAYPEKKLFIDGRLPQVAYAGRSFLEEYYDFFRKKTDYEKKLEQYNIKLVLIKTTDKQIKVRKWEEIVFLLRQSSFNSTNYLRNYLNSSTNWQKIYSDPVASIYLKIK